MVECQDSAPSPWTLKNVNRLLRLSLVLLCNDDLKFYSYVLALKICTKSIDPRVCLVKKF